MLHRSWGTHLGRSLVSVTLSCHFLEGCHMAKEGLWAPGSTRLPVLCSHSVGGLHSVPGPSRAWVSSSKTRKGRPHA